MLRTIEILQNFNSRISGIEWAPHPDDYPHSIEAFMWPTLLTEWETYDTWRAGDNHFAEGTILVTGFFGALGVEAAILGLARGDVVRTQQSVMLYYLDQQSYVIKGGTRYILEKGPPQIIQVISAQPTFQMTGARVLEYPANSENFFHGFELRFTVGIQPGSC